jgi:translation initiation factor 2 alpha subunit (eIF-2alpha)
MKKLLLAAMLSLLSVTAFAADNCEQIKSQIEAKIKGLGVPTYKLEVVDADANTGGKQVGSCDGGKKKIVYWRL